MQQAALTSERIRRSHRQRMESRPRFPAAEGAIACLLLRGFPAAAAAALLLPVRRTLYQQHHFAASGKGNNTLVFYTWIISLALPISFPPPPISLSLSLLSLSRPPSRSLGWVDLEEGAGRQGPLQGVQPQRAGSQGGHRLCRRNAGHALEEPGRQPAVWQRPVGRGDF